MSDFFLGEIRLFAFDRIPQGWLPCQGQTLQIMQNQALYALLGTTYGGNGMTTFNLPDLRGQVPMCIGPGNQLGVAGGEATHTLTISEMPQHAHSVLASATPPALTSPAGNTWSAMTNAYAEKSDVQMSTNALSITGASQPHNNMQPYLTLNLCISTTGIFPPRP